MRILLPLNNNNRSGRSQANPLKQSTHSSSHSTDNSSEEESEEYEEDEEYEDEPEETLSDANSDFQNTAKDWTEPAEREDCREKDLEDSGTAHKNSRAEPLQKPVLNNRKRDLFASLGSAAPASERVATETTANNATSKRIRVLNNTSNNSTVSSSDDSKPAAKPMVAPKRSPLEDSQRLDKDRGRSDSSWEENQPTPFGNQNYFRYHPENDPIEYNTPSSAASAPFASAGSNYYDPAGEEVVFAAELKRQGLEIVEQEGDGNCLFRAVSLQVYGDASMHAQVREQCLNFMAVNEEHFGQFLAGEPFKSYIARKRKLGVHGNNPEIQAISELFNRPVQVFMPRMGAKPLNIFHKEYKTTDAPIRLSYHDNNHYNAVIDPVHPTAGLGLGFPGLQPGLADKLQLAAATAESDHQSDLELAIQASRKDHSQFNEDQLQRVLKESSYSHDSMYKNKAIALSDVDATNFELEQTILETSLKSYYASFDEDEDGRKQRASPTGRRRRYHPPAPLLPSQEDYSNIKLPAVSTSAAAAAAPPSPEHPSSSPDRAESSAAADLPMSPYEYPPVVQELVMNGFDFAKVVRAFELVGDNFDDLLGFLMSNTS